MVQSTKFKWSRRLRRIRLDLANTWQKSIPTKWRATTDRPPPRHTEQKAHDPWTNTRLSNRAQSWQASHGWPTTILAIAANANPAQNAASYEPWSRSGRPTPARRPSSRATRYIWTCRHSKRHVIAVSRRTWARGSPGCRYSRIQAEPTIWPLLLRFHRRT